MGFSRQEYWSGLPFPSPGDLPNPGIKPSSPTLLAYALTSEPPAALDSTYVFPQAKFLLKVPENQPPCNFSSPAYLLPSKVLKNNSFPSLHRIPSDIWCSHPPSHHFPRLNEPNIFHSLFYKRIPVSFPYPGLSQQMMFSFILGIQT